MDAYQEDLIGLGDLRSRAPALRRRQAAIEKELEGVALQALEKSRLTQLNASMENFLAALRQSAKKLEVVERQKVVRLVIKQIIVNGDALTIQHSIPISRSNESQPRAGYACVRGVVGRPRCCLGGVKIASTSLSARPVARFMSETDAIKSSVSRPSVTA